MEIGGKWRDITLRTMARKPHINMVMLARPIPLRVLEGILIELKLINSQKLVSMLEMAKKLC